MSKVTNIRTNQECATGWILGAVASWLSHPLTDKAALVLNSGEAETAFLGRSWVHRHALLAVLDHCDEVEARARQIRDDFLALKSRPFVLRWGVKPFSGMEAMLAKLGSDRAEVPGVYRALFEIMGEEAVGARILRHHKAPSFALIERLHCLPDWARAVQWQRFEKHTLWLVRQQGLIAEMFDRMGYGAREEIIRALPDLDRIRYSPEVRRLWAKASFAEPPWPGAARLKPVRTLDELKDAAKRFDNCALDQFLDGPPGVSAIYVWSGPEPAMVELCRTSAVHWICNCILGPKNEDVSRQTADAILGELPKIDDWPRLAADAAQAGEMASRLDSTASGALGQANA